MIIMNILNKLHFMYYKLNNFDNRYVQIQCILYVYQAFQINNLYTIKKIFKKYDFKVKLISTADLPFKQITDYTLI